jgi:hypothetical protein
MSPFMPQGRLVRQITVRQDNFEEDSLRTAQEGLSPFHTVACRGVDAAARSATGSSGMALWVRALVAIEAFIRPWRPARFLLLPGLAKEARACSPSLPS